MGTISRKVMQNIVSYMELILSAFLSVVIIVLILKLVWQEFPGIWVAEHELTYYLEQAMTLAIGIEFVKMLCTHTPGTIIDVLLFAFSRQMVVEHLTVTQTVPGVIAIAGLFAIRKYLFHGLDGTDHMICRGSHTVRQANMISGAKIPEDSAKLLRDVMVERLQEEDRNPTIGATVFYKDCALRVDSLKNDMITRVEVIKIK